MGRTIWHLLLLTGVGALVMFVNLGGPPLWDRDEPRNASCAREMMERGDWVVPTFNDDLRVLKPAMKYWLMIVAYKMFGVNEFAARFFSAVAAVLAAWATYFVGRQLYSERVGLWAGIILVSSLLFSMAGHLAKIDAALTLFSTLTVLAYVSFAFGAKEQQGPALVEPVPSSWGPWVLVYLALGLGALGKGLPGVVPAAVLGMFLLIVRLPAWQPVGWWQQGVNLVRPFAPLHFWHTFWAMRPLMGTVIVLAVAAPWYVLVGVQTDGEFVRSFFLQHHLGRAMEPMENHSGPFLFYYLATICLGFFPWSVFLVPLVIWMVSRLATQERGWAATLLLVCWVGVYVVLFSCARTKLPSYITPCFPGLALLMGAFVEEVSQGVVGALRAWVQVSLGVLALAGTAIAVVPYFLAALLPGLEWLILSGAILTVAGVAAMLLYGAGRTLMGAVVVSVGIVAFTGLVFGMVLVAVGQHKEQAAVCAQVREQYPEARFAMVSDIDPSWVFYASRPVVPIALNEKPSEQKRWTAKPMTIEEFAASGEGRYVIARDRDWAWLEERLPKGSRIVAEPAIFLKRDRHWVLIECGRKAPTGRAQLSGGPVGK